MSEIGKLIEDLVKKITIICPTTILQDARQTERCDDPYNHMPLVDDLFNLDKEISVPNSATGTKHLSQLFLDLVKNIACLVTEKNPNFVFDVVPVGSFPSNVKIGDIDEFDYILKWITRNKEIEDAFYKYHVQHQTDLGQPAEVFGFYETFTAIIKELNEEFSVGISEPLYSGPATNIEFSWKCSDSHVHNVSLDLTIAVETNESFSDYIKSRNCPLQSSPFEGLQQKIDKNLLIIHKDAYYVATNILDDQMFAACDSVSDTIRPCYRLLKFVRDHLFPVVFQQKYLLSGSRTEKFESIVSSHTLKQLMFNEVANTKDTDKWSIPLFVEIIASLLKSLAQKDESEFVQSNYDQYTLQIRDFLTRDNICIKKDAFVFMKMACDELVEWLNNPLEHFKQVTESVFEQQRAQSHCIPIQNALFRVNDDALLFLSQLFGEKITCFPSQIPKPNLCKFQLVKWIYKYRKQRFETMIMIDLTAETYVDIFLTVGLFKFSVLTEENLRSGTFHIKLQKFKEFFTASDVSVRRIVGEYAARNDKIKKTLQNDPGWADNLYKDLKSVFRSICNDDKVMLLQDVLNFRVDNTLKQVNEKVYKVCSTLIQQLDESTDVSEGWEFEDGEDNQFDVEWQTKLFLIQLAMEHIKSLDI